MAARPPATRPNRRTPASGGGNGDPDALTAAVGARIRALRNRASLTMEELATRAGVRIETVGKVERGEQSPTVRMLAQLAAGLGCDPAKFFVDGPSGVDAGVPADVADLVRYLTGRGPVALSRARLAVLAATAEDGELPAVKLP